MGVLLVVPNDNSNSALSAAKPFQAIDRQELLINRSSLLATAGFAVSIDELGVVAHITRAIPGMFAFTAGGVKILVYGPANDLGEQAPCGCSKQSGRFPSQLERTYK